MLKYNLQILILFCIQVCSGSNTTTMAIGSSGCIRLPLTPTTSTIFMQYENTTVCYRYENLYTKIPASWNRTFSCNGSESLFELCINDVTFSDSGYFALLRKLIPASVLASVTLLIEGPPTVNKMDDIFVIEGSNMLLNCSFTQGHPKATTIYWIRPIISPMTFQTGVTLNLTNIKRSMSGIFICVAENVLSTGKGYSNNSVSINVQYPPSVNNMTGTDIVEGHPLSITCRANPGNPNFTTLFWTKVDDQGLIQNGSTLRISNIQRSSSGTYVCTAENIYYNGKKGIHSQSMFVNVLYKPEVTITTASPYMVIEGRLATLECSLKFANPNTSITWRWFRKDKVNNVLHNQTTLMINDIQRNKSGQYGCTATNTAGTSNVTTIDVVVLYAPTVLNLDQQNVEEGKNLSVTCQATPGIPNSTTIYWTYADNKGFKQDGSTLRLPNIQRKSSGTYICTAENNYNERDKGIHNQTMVVNVQYKPLIQEKPRTVVNESQKVTLSRDIVSNPLSNVYWYSGSELLSTQLSVNTSSFTINKTSCTDTKNFTIVASNTIEGNISASVELIVNCKPQSDNNITLGVTDTTGIEFSVTIIAHPKPQYELEFENETEINRLTDMIAMNALNNFSIHFNQTSVEKSHYGVYRLRVYNSYGETFIYVNVVPQRKPVLPNDIEIFCEKTSAKVQWISSFNGGDPQKFSVYALDGQFRKSMSENISDKGENKIHIAFLQNLQPSTRYEFYVSAQNSHGLSSSNKTSCITLAVSNDKLAVIVGVAAAGGITLAIGVIVAFLFLRRFRAQEKHAGQSQRLHQDDESDDTNVDGLKENSLYVSAGPRDDEKTEVAVYAAVAKKIPQSDNNSNLYADVKKSGRQETNKGTMSSEAKPKKGLFKKDEKAKHKRGKKPKNRPGEADVYENSEDIAMSTNVDNVYSNAAQKGQNKQKERGYKNKDGLLYVEVNFDGKQGQDNPIIHGEDEKTDYATVEFPMPSALHKASGSEEL